MKKSYEDLTEIFDSGTKQEKIKVLESLVNTSESKIIKLMISMLDDPEIEVRGESFSSLVINQNDISGFLIEGLNYESKNIRGFSALILANRHDSDSISSIIKLTHDPSSMVRAYALGSLGYLKAQEASKEIHSCFSDKSLEVKKSALKAAMDIGDRVPPEEFKEISKEKDSELERLLVKAKQNC